MRPRRIHCFVKNDCHRGTAEVKRSFDRHGFSFHFKPRRIRMFILTDNISIPFVVLYYIHTYHFGIYDGKIEKPTGGVGKPGRGGYNLLRVALKWPEKRFNEVKKFIDETVEAKLDCLQPLGKQQYLKLEEVRTLAVAKFSFLEEYRGDWVVYDFIRCRLKYRKQALKRTASMKAAADSGSRQRISCYLNSDS
ncbi:hypothetical protein LENED_004231 [Lentinula edodes]|uniref:Uncharacterized protein n=1 Tax=Lentinula edodes TaxID=5353 RepID=A0A1Q3E5R7_LENED|nr:hypothetical protein LENED_004231 [Lentinula edodes]